MLQNLNKEEEDKINITKVKGVPEQFIEKCSNLKSTETTELSVMEMQLSLFA